MAVVSLEDIYYFLLSLVYIQEKNNKR